VHIGLLFSLYFFSTINSGIGLKYSTSFSPIHA
jgi:hypothetical protein